MANIETERLIIGTWEERFFEPFAAMNADPVVMTHFPSVLTRQQSRRFFERAQSVLQRDGFYFQPIIEKTSDRFAGFAGLARVNFDAHFTPAVEIGWRLPHDCWGKGYASEAARGLLDYGFQDLKLQEVVSFAVKANHRSHAVMTRIGMTQDKDGSFLHPRLEPDDELACHVLYRLRRDDHSEGLET